MAFSSAQKPYRIAVADPAERPEGVWGRGGALFLDQTEARRAEKNVFVTSPPPHPPLSQGLNPPLERASVHTFRGDCCGEANETKLCYTDL